MLRDSLWSSPLEPNSCSPQCSLQCSLQSVFDPPRVRMGFLSEKRRSPARGGSWVSGCRFLRQERRWLLHLSVVTIVTQSRENFKLLSLIAKFEVARCDRLLFGLVIVFQTPRATSRSTAPGIGNAGLRRPSSTRSRPQPVRRRRPGRGLARLAGCGGISRKLPCGFLQGTAFPLGDSRASSIVVCSSTIGNAQKIFVGCVS